MAQFYIPLSRTAGSDVIFDAIYVVESPEFGASHKLYISLKRTEEERRLIVRFSFTDSPPYSPDLNDDMKEVYVGDTFRFKCIEDDDNAIRTFVDLMIFPDGRKIKLEAVKTEPIP
jgi:hypothetical protein